MLCLFRLSLTLNSQVGIPLAPSARLIKCWRDEGRGNQRNIRELETNMCTAGENGDVCTAARRLCVIISSKIGRERRKEEKRNILQQPFLLDGSARRQKDLCAGSGLGFRDFVVLMKLLNGKEKQKCRPTLPFQHGGEGGGAATTAFMAKSPVGN